MFYKIWNCIRLLISINVHLKIQVNVRICIGTLHIFSGYVIHSHLYRILHFFLILTGNLILTRHQLPVKQVKVFEKDQNRCVCVCVESIFYYWRSFFFFFWEGIIIEEVEHISIVGRSAIMDCELYALLCSKAHKFPVNTVLTSKIFNKKLP